MEKEFVQTLFLLEKLAEEEQKKEKMYLFRRDGMYRKLIIDIVTNIKLIEQIIKSKKIRHVTQNLAGIYSSYDRMYEMFDDIAIFIDSLLENEK